MANLRLVPQGHIVSGNLFYMVDDSVVTFSGDCTVKVGFFKRTIPVQGTVAAEPGSLKRNAWRQVGAEHSFSGKLDCKVVAIEGDHAHVQVSSDAASLSGVVTVDVGGDGEAPIDILHVDGQVVFQGIRQRVTADKD